MTVKQIFSEPLSLSVIIATVMTLIQVSPLKIDPWTLLKKLLSHIVSCFGKMFNSSLEKELEIIKDDLNDIKQKQDDQCRALAEHVRDDDKRDFDTRVQRIFRFNADIMRGERITHEYYCEMLKEIDIVEPYISKHEEYKDTRVNMAIANIRRFGEECEKSHSWLI